MFQAKATMWIWAATYIEPIVDNGKTSPIGKNNSCWGAGLRIDKKAQKQTQISVGKDSV